MDGRGTPIIYPIMDRFSKFFFHPYSKVLNSVSARSEIFPFVFRKSVNQYDKVLGVASKVGEESNIYLPKVV